MVSRSTFSWDNAAGPKHKIRTRAQTSREELFMMSLLSGNQSGIIQPGSELGRQTEIVRLFQGCIVPGLFESTLGAAGDVASTSLLFVFRLAYGLFAFFLSIDRVQHVVIETVTAVVAVFAEIEIKFRALRQPE